MRFILSILVLFATQGGMGQSMLQGQVFDSRSGRPLADATVQWLEQGRGTTTDQFGQFQFFVDSAVFSTLRISFIGYETQQIGWVSGQGELSIGLSPRDYGFDTLTITSEYEPEVVYASPEHHVADYRFWKGGLLMLTYDKRMEAGCHLRWIDSLGQELHSEIIPKTWKPQKILQDYSGSHYLCGEEKIWAIRGPFAELRFEMMEKSHFADEIEPILDSVDGKFIISTWFPRFPAFDYYHFLDGDSSMAHIHQVSDDFMLELCRAEYRFMPPREKLYFRRLALKTGMEKEVLACIGSYEGRFYQPIKAPMFLLRDTMYIFDHYDHHIYSYASDRTLLDSVAIDYHRFNRRWNNDFTEELFADEEEAHVYALFSRSGGRTWLQRISLDSGELKESFDLFYPYPENIQVRGGEVFYIWRPFESSQKRYLYRERYDQN